MEEFLLAIDRAGERRAFERHNVDLPVTLTPRGKGSRGAAQGHITDLSAGGAAIRTDLTVAVGDELDLSGLRSVTLTGRVVTVGDGLLRVQFRLDEATTRQIETVLQHAA